MTCKYNIQQQLAFSTASRRTPKSIFLKMTPTQADSEHRKSVQYFLKATTRRLKEICPQRFKSLSLPYIPGLWMRKSGRREFLFSKLNSEVVSTTSPVLDSSGSVSVCRFLLVDTLWFVASVPKNNKLQPLQRLQAIICWIWYTTSLHSQTHCCEQTN